MLKSLWRHRVYLVQRTASEIYRVPLETQNDLDVQGWHCLLRVLEEGRVRLGQPSLDLHPADAAVVGVPPGPAYA